jgi:DNA-directed RNA polymerase subunit RPC12/RpoP
MKYVQCPRCRARFHTGVIYERVEQCARCGAPLLTGRSGIQNRLRAAIDRKRIRESLDWEAVTGSQYVRRSVVTTERGGDSAAAA